MVVKDKVLVYLTWRGRLLTFTQPRFPEAGRQVVAGTLQPGETPAAAALRELAEESGIVAAGVERVLGSFQYSMAAFGRDELQQRYVVHAVLADDFAAPESWTHFERQPDGGGAPIEFRFRWLPLQGDAPDLIGGHGFFLPMLRHFLG